MTNYASWRPRYTAMCPEPGPLDLFLVILINGKRVGLYPAVDHARLREAANRLAEQERCQIKVLPMSGEELLNFLGIPPAAPQPMENMDPAFRAQAIQNFNDAICESNDRREREDALAMLDKLGALQ